MAAPAGAAAPLHFVGIKRQIDNTSPIYDLSAKISCTAGYWSAKVKE